MIRFLLFLPLHILDCFPLCYIDRNVFGELMLESRLPHPHVWGGAPAGLGAEPQRGLGQSPPSAEPQVRTWFNQASRFGPKFV